MSTYNSDSQNMYEFERSNGMRSEKPPFQLCFSRDRQLGRSDISHSKTDGKPVLIRTYSREAEEARDIDVSEALRYLERGEKKDPMDIYRWPLLSSQTYGWWYKKGIQPRDPRVNFHKRTSDLVNRQMKIYTEDRKLRIPKR